MTKYEYPKRKCKLCGKEFTPKRADSLYCCRDCSQRACREKKQKPKERKCKHCGTKFVAVHGREKYCSEKCRKEVINNTNKALYHKRKEKNPPTICAYCNKEFIPNRFGQKFCGAECANEHRKNPKKLEMVICIRCGKEFMPNAFNQKYCSEECKRYICNKKKRTDYHFQKYEGVKTEKKKKPKKYTIRAWNKLSPSERRALMSLQEVAVEDRKYHLTYGQAEKAQRWGQLPNDYGKREKTVEVVNENY